MLKYKVKCLIEAAKEGEVEVIAHQTNCFNRMNNGIAPQIAEFCPDAVDADARTKSADHAKLGTYSSACSLEYGTIVYNLYGQYGDHLGVQNTQYNHLDKCLYHMSQSLPKATKIGLPKLGAGRGGGDWAIIEKIIEKALIVHDVTIYVRDSSEIPVKRN